jgi:IclR family pca regulon transcriptional regulator
MRKYRPKKPRYFVNSLAKGLSLLEAFAEACRPLTLSEIAHAMKVNNTTATRLCYTLTEMGFIQRDDHRQYRPTPRVLTLGYAFISGSDWREIAQYYLESLFKETHETVNLSILDGSEILYIIRITERNYLPFDIRIGAKLPVYCTAMGKVLMAMGAPEKVKAILKALEFKPLTPRTITTLDKFTEELEKVRKKGYGINDDELSIGNRAIAAPVRDRDGYAVAAINIAVPSAHYSRSEMEKILASLVTQTAREISDALLKMKAPLVLRGSP